MVLLLVMGGCHSGFSLLVMYLLVTICDSEGESEEWGFFVCGWLAIGLVKMGLGFFMGVFSRFLVMTSFLSCVG